MRLNLKANQTKLYHTIYIYKTHSHTLIKFRSYYTFYTQNGDIWNKHPSCVAVYNVLSLSVDSTEGKTCHRTLRKTAYYSVYSSFPHFEMNEFYYLVKCFMLSVSQYTHYHVDNYRPTILGDCTWSVRLNAT